MNDARRSDLERIYRESVYVIHDGDLRIETLIDQPSTLLSARLAAAGADCAALISACNPQSRELEPQANLRRQADFEAALCDEGLRFFPALGRSPDGSWQEPSVLVLALSAAASRQWAARWGQVAFVHYDARGCGRLHFVEDAA